MTPKRIAFLVLGVLLATFFIQNAEAVPVRFLFWGMTVSRSIVLLITFALGLIVGLAPAGWEEETVPLCSRASRIEREEIRGIFFGRGRSLIFSTGMIAALTT